MSSRVGQLNADDVALWAESHANSTVRGCSNSLREWGLTSDSFARPDICQDLQVLGLGLVTAKDLTAAFRHDARAEAVVFWDIENLGIPRGLSADDAVERIRTGLRSYGLMRSAIKVYGKHDALTSTKQADLVQSGCEFLLAPHDGRKDTADKLLIADILLWAMDHPPPAKIVLMCGDKDLSYVISRLRSRKYFVVLVHNSHTVERLKRNSDRQIPWELLMRDRQEEQEEDAEEELFANPLKVKKPATSAISWDKGTERPFLTGNPTSQTHSVGAKANAQAEGALVEPAKAHTESRIGLLATGLPQSIVPSTSNIAPLLGKPSTPFAANQRLKNISPSRSPSPHQRHNLMQPNVPLRVDIDDDDVESVHFQDFVNLKEQTRIRGSGVVELVSVLRGLDRKMASGRTCIAARWHSWGVVCHNLRRHFPILKDVYKDLALLIAVAAKEGLVHCKNARSQSEADAETEAQHYNEARVRSSSGSSLPDENEKQGKKAHYHLFLKVTPAVTINTNSPSERNKC